MRQTFHEVVHDFIKHQRQHMDKEERLLFPAAVQRLRPEDWAAIDSRVNDRKDPLFNGAIETKFQALQRTILRWEREAEIEPGENRARVDFGRSTGWLATQCRWSPALPVFPANREFYREFYNIAASGTPETPNK